MIGCGSATNPHEDLSSRALASMEEMGDILASIKDEASAREAVPRLERLGATMKEIAEEAKKLGDPPAELKARLQASMDSKSAEMEAKMGEFMKYMIKNPKIMEILAPALTKISPRQ